MENESDPITLTPGQKPPKGATVELCRRNYPPGNPSVYSWFTADGEWETPRTVNDFYYRYSTPEMIARGIAQYV